MHGLLVPVLLVVVTASNLVHSLGADYDNVISVFHNSSSQCNSTALHISKFPADLQNSTEVQFCERVIFMSKSLIVKNKTHIKFSGNTNLTCLESGGFIFETVMDLTIHGINIINCGLVHHEITEVTASILLLNCFKVNIIKINAINSTDVDLYMLNLKEVKIAESSFSKHNGNNTFIPNSRVHVKFGYEITTNYSIEKSVIFVNCTFGYKNLTSENERVCARKQTKQNDVGGGLTVVLGRNTSNVILTIESCVFQNLYTSLKGGVYMLLTKNAHGNTISMKNSQFVNNTCFKCGGAGLRIDFMYESSDFPPSGNTISLFNSSFTGNCAKYGGGVFINSSKSTRSQFTHIELRLCNWSRNTARYGSAIDAVEEKGESAIGQLVLKTLLKNCTFESNRIEAIKFGKGKVTVFGQGTVSAINFHLNFEGNTLFTENVGSPLYLSSSYADFSANSSTTFMKNKGLNGGAITILGTAAVRAKGGNTFTFTENEAYFKGGAIYYNNIDGHIYLASHNCFLQYIHGEHNAPTNDSKKPRYIFMNNKAGIAFNKNDSLGKSIYASTLYQCKKYCGYSYEVPYKADNITMNCVGSFEYKNILRRFELATSEWNMKVSDNIPLLRIIPGKEVELPVETTDELQQKLNTVYKVILWQNNTTDIEPWILPAYRYIHNRKIALQGEPSSDTLELVLTTVHNREIRLTINIEIVPCPPGYILHEKRLCRCSADLDVKYHYEGIIRCDSTSFRAQLQSGFWVGYSTELYHSLIGSICPRGFCSIFSNDSIQKNIPLPESFNITALDYLLCGDSRTGKLCARCRENKSVHYHSNSYRCKENRICKAGWLLYGLSELVPVTFIFLTVTLFDVQLTSGATLGIILYYQLLDTMLITANNIIKFPKETYQVYKIHRLFAQMFNLNFFVHEDLSFCLWEGATTLDIIVFKYCTIAYALLMVFTTILIMKTCNYKYCCMKLRRVTRRKRQVTNSVIHGISGFFILCYSECVRVSLLLLKPIQYEDLYNTLNNTKYVLYDGEMKYLAGAHLKYAVPAFFFLLTIAFMPPILLLAYPLCYRVLALLRLQESKCSRLMCMLIPLEKLKPFFDSFQGSFKDQHRYTPGLYFVYRLTAVCLSVFTTHNTSLFYTLIEILLLVMIFVLAYCQPHKKSRHNRQDLFAFVILAIVNALTFYSYKKSVDVVDQQHMVNVATSVQTAFFYIPTLCIAIRGVLLIIRTTRRCWVEKRSEVEDELLELERDTECSLDSPQYERMFENTHTSVP